MFSGAQCILILWTRRRRPLGSVLSTLYHISLSTGTHMASCYLHSERERIRNFPESNRSVYTHAIRFSSRDPAVLPTWLHNVPAAHRTGLTGYGALDEGWRRWQARIMFRNERLTGLASHLQAIPHMLIVATSPLYTHWQLPSTPFAGLNCSSTIRAATRWPIEGSSSST